MVDIRLKTVVIVRKNGKYLVGRILWSEQLRWSDSPSDAWRTRDMEKAREVARKTGGVMVLYNPVVRQMKVLGA